MKSKSITPLIITIIMILVAIGGGTFYFTIFRQMPVSRLFLVGIVIATLGIIGAMIAVFIQRNKELEEENEDDYRKY